MESQKKVTNKGGTMRLGSWKCELKDKTNVSDIYDANIIHERHRHRYEFNSDYLDLVESKGLIASGINSETGLVEILELNIHPWFIGVQFHPEYKSTVYNPHPLFVSFVEAGLKHSKLIQ